MKQRHVGLYNEFLNENLNANIGKNKDLQKDIDEEISKLKDSMSKLDSNSLGAVSLASEKQRLVNQIAAKMVAKAKLMQEEAKLSLDLAKQDEQAKNNIK
jgi:hypothetical protein